jgi:hypothetical protein
MRKLTSFVYLVTDLRKQLFSITQRRVLPVIHNVLNLDLQTEYLNFEAKISAVYSGK